jgi:hypothetical protein
VLGHPEHPGTLLLASDDLGSDYTLLKQLPPLFTQVTLL